MKRRLVRGGGGGQLHLVALLGAVRMRHAVRWARARAARGGSGRRTARHCRRARPARARLALHSPAATAMALVLW